MRQLAAIAAILVLTACSGGTVATPADGGTSRPPFTTTAPVTVVPASPSGSTAEVSAARWQAILDDLAGRGVSATPEVVSAERKTWNDGSLGCPKPGSSYTQAIVEGLQVIVRAGGTTYDYRFGRGDTPKLCQR